MTEISDVVVTAVIILGWLFITWEPSTIVFTCPCGKKQTVPRRPGIRVTCCGIQYTRDLV